jgi:hypothetical protein
VGEVTNNINNMPLYSTSLYMCIEFPVLTTEVSKDFINFKNLSNSSITTLKNYTIIQNTTNSTTYIDETNDETDDEIDQVINLVENVTKNNSSITLKNYTIMQNTTNSTTYIDETDEVDETEGVDNKRLRLGIFVRVIVLTSLFFLLFALFFRCIFSLN